MTHFITTHPVLIAAYIYANAAVALISTIYVICAIRATNKETKAIEDEDYNWE